MLSCFMNNIIIFGPPGAGKGTQAEKISEVFKFKHLSTGHVLREAVEKNDELSKEILAIMSQGALVSDAIVNKIIKKQIEENKTTQFIFDGYPRNLEQAHFLDTLINTKNIILINLVVSPEEVITRLSLRKRDDDEQENIKRRLEVYHKNTEPILNYYQSSGRLLKVNGEGSVEQVFKRLKKLVTN